MAEYIQIKNDDNTITLIRSKITSPIESPLTVKEKIINMLYNKLKQNNIEIY